MRWQVSCEMCNEMMLDLCEEPLLPKLYGLVACWAWTAHLQGREDSR